MTGRRSDVRARVQNGNCLTHVPKDGPSSPFWKYTEVLGDYLSGAVDSVSNRKTDGQGGLCVWDLWMMGPGEVIASKEEETEQTLSILTLTPGRNVFRHSGAHRLCHQGIWHVTTVRGRWFLTPEIFLEISMISSFLF